MEPEAIAHHEAGHAVVARLLRIQFTHASIIEQDESLGRVRTHAFRKDADPEFMYTSGIKDRLMREITTCFAGLPAQVRYCGEEDPEGASADDAVAETLGERLIPDDEERPLLLAWLRWRAAVMVANENHWPAIAAVAAALLEKKELRQQQVDAIMRAVYATQIPVNGIDPLAVRRRPYL